MDETNLSDGDKVRYKGAEYIIGDIRPTKYGDGYTLLSIDGHRGAFVARDKFEPLGESVTSRKLHSIRRTWYQGRK